MIIFIHSNTFARDSVAYKTRYPTGTFKTSNGVFTNSIGLMAVVCVSFTLIGVLKDKDIRDKYISQCFC